MKAGSSLRSLTFPRSRFWRAAAPAFRGPACEAVRATRQHRSLQDIPAMLDKRVQTQAARKLRPAARSPAASGRSRSRGPARAHRPADQQGHRAASRWCAGSSSAACRRTERRAFLFTNVIDSKGRRYDMPVVVGALASSPAIYALGMGRPVEEIGDAWMAAIAHPIPPVATNDAPCQEVVITGDALRREGG